MVPVKALGTIPVVAQTNEACNANTINAHMSASLLMLSMVESISVEFIDVMLRFYF